MEREGIWRKYLPLSQCFSLLLPKNSHQFSSLRGTDARKQKSCIYNHQSISQTAFMWSFKGLARVSLNFPLGTGPRNIAGWEILMHHQLPRTLKGQRQSFAVIWPTICSPGKDLLPKGLSLLSWVPKSRSNPQSRFSQAQEPWTQRIPTPTVSPFGRCAQ